MQFLLFYTVRDILLTVQSFSFLYFAFFSVNHTAESSTPEHDITVRFARYVSSLRYLTTATVGDTIWFEIEAPGNDFFILSLAVHFFK